MKNLVIASALLLTACGTVQMSTPTTPATPSTPATATHPAYQPATGTNWTTPLPANINQGIGPVNIAESNFYFAGNLQVQNGTPVFYDCAAGTNIPLAQGKGVYESLINQYNQQAAQGSVMTAKIHGYFVNEPTAGYPKQLVVTYVNDLAAGESCNSPQILPGTWTANLVGAEKGTVLLTLTKTFDFSCTINTGGKTEQVSGSWMMTSPQEIGLFYTSLTPLLGHSIAYNPNNMTLFVPTQKGTLIFKKQ